VVGFWSPEAHRRGLFLALTGEAALPMSACGDPLRLRQILNNLISNAVKFTETGGVTLEVEAGGNFAGPYVLQPRSYSFLHACTHQGDLPGGPSMAAFDTQFL
jgi:hypothetical protein